MTPVERTYLIASATWLHADAADSICAVRQNLLDAQIVDLLVLLRGITFR